MEIDNLSEQAKVQIESIRHSLAVDIMGANEEVAAANGRAAAVHLDEVIEPVADNPDNPMADLNNIAATVNQTKIEANSLDMAATKREIELMAEETGESYSILGDIVEMALDGVGAVGKKLGILGGYDVCGGDLCTKNISKHLINIDEIRLSPHMGGLAA